MASIKKSLECGGCLNNCALNVSAHISTWSYLVPCLIVARKKSSARLLSYAWIGYLDHQVKIQQKHPYTQTLVIGLQLIRTIMESSMVLQSQFGRLKIAQTICLGSNLSSAPDSHREPLSFCADLDGEEFFALRGFQKNISPTIAYCFFIPRTLDKTAISEEIFGSLG